MIYRVEEGKPEAGKIGYQNSKHAYTFSHWPNPKKTKLSSWIGKLNYQPIGPTILVEWEK